MSRFRIVSAVAIALMLAACSGSGSDPLGPEGGPRMNGNGGLVVGGNDTPPDSTGGATYSTTSGSGDHVPVPGDTIPRDENGGLVVGGN